jgi:hypothetical protein
MFLIFVCKTLLLRGRRPLLGGSVVLIFGVIGQNWPFLEVFPRKKNRGFIVSQFLIFPSHLNVTRCISFVRKITKLSNTKLVRFSEIS